MKRICLDIQPLLKVKTGIGNYTENLLKGLVNNEQNDYVGIIYTLLESKKEDIEKISLKNLNYKNCKFLPYFYRKLNFLWKCVPFSINFLTKLNFDIYHSFDIRIPYKIKGKLIITIHDLIPFLFPEYMNNINKDKFLEYINNNAKRADLIITVSEYSKKEILKYLDVSEDKIRIVSPGIDLNKYSKSYFEEKNSVKIKYKLPENFILFLGALEPKKNIVNIIKGFEKYKKDFKDKETKLIIAGGKGWKYEEIFETYENSKIKEDIIFIGYIDEEDKIPLYKLSRLFVFPSLYEGFGMPVLEAMAAGTPVITSNISSLPEVVGDGAILINPYSIEEISNAINKILNDNEEVVKQMIIKGKEQSKKFIWENSVKKLEKIYEEL